jgi:hypothetical protein
MIMVHQYPSRTKYRAALIEWMQTFDWHWFITIEIGKCPPDEEVLRRLRLIEATLCKRYLLNRFHKLPRDQRFSIAIAFEGDTESGSRHAHLLLYVPPPRKGDRSQQDMIEQLPNEFTMLWTELGRPKHFRALHSVVAVSPKAAGLNFLPAVPNLVSYTLKVVTPWQRPDFRAVGMTGGLDDMNCRTRFPKFANIRGVSNRG